MLEGKLLTVKDVAEFYQKSEGAIRVAVHRRADWLPDPIKIGRSLRWTEEDIFNKLEELKQAVPARPTRYL